MRAKAVTPGEQCGNFQRDWSNVTRLSSRHCTVHRRYNYYTHAKRLALSVQHSELRVLNVQWERLTLLVHPLFLVPPFFWHPALNNSAQRTNMMPDIACGMFAPPSPPYYILTLRRICRNSALLTGTTDTMNGYKRVSTTCITETPLSLEEKITKKWYQFEELMQQFDYRNSLVEFVDWLPYRPSHLPPFLGLLFPPSTPSNLDLRGGEGGREWEMGMSSSSRFLTYRHQMRLNTLRNEAWTRRSSYPTHRNWDHMTEVVWTFL